ncbi:MAG: hypothetical protein KKE12_06785 [Proteobacteria bacterium]|nr:hypothetical protein [Pseudomonadota bacterium]
MQMQIICDTHILIFWQDYPKRLSNTAQAAIETALHSVGGQATEINPKTG